MAASKLEQQAKFAIVQGGLDAELRRESATSLAQMPFDGFAVGGLSVGEEPSDMYRVIGETTPHLPSTKPRYLMGVGRPIDLLEGIARGIDMFDCVMPTRNGRNGLAFTWDGTLRFRNAIHTDDARPIDETCPCLACRHSRAYIRHLFIAKEMLGPILLTHHNLVFYQRLMTAALGANRCWNLPSLVKCTTYESWRHRLCARGQLEHFIQQLPADKLHTRQVKGSFPQISLSTSN